MNIKKGEETFDVRKVVVFENTISLPQANSWYDTGLPYDFLASGTYIVQLYTEDWGVNEQYWERCSGIMAWYSVDTNSDLADEIPLSKAGHATNDHNIKLRVARFPSSHCQLQISDTKAWTGSGAIRLSFRKMI